MWSLANSRRNPRQSKVLLKVAIFAISPAQADREEFLRHLTKWWQLVESKTPKLDGAHLDDPAPPATASRPGHWNGWSQTYRRTGGGSKNGNPHF